jgi:hypothetical protein
MVYNTYVFNLGYLAPCADRDPLANQSLCGLLISAEYGLSSTSSPPATRLPLSLHTYPERHLNPCRHCQFLVLLVNTRVLSA